MFSYLFILGSHPDLSKAEISARLPQATISSLAENIILLKLPKAIEQPQRLLDQLGGTIKIGELVDRFRYTPSEILLEVLSSRFLDIRDIGISFYHFPTTQHHIIISTKKELKKSGIAKRFIFERTAPELNAATLDKNNLTTKGLELLMVNCHSKTKNNNEIYLAHTLAYQNINDYTQRDYGKPRPDARSGMLPPKLSQILISLAQITEGSTIYDPFCGSGIILQEAMLQNYHIYGSDISVKAVNNTQANLKWLVKTFQLQFPNYRQYIESKIFNADATTYRLHEAVDAIITEPYLGPAHRNMPDTDFIATIIRQLLVLYKQFLQNSLQHLKKDGKIVMILPVFNHPTGEIFIKLSDLLDQNLQKHYTILSKDLIYRQPHQKVFRQILVLKKTS